MADDDDHRYWFPAKRIGYGWGPPSVWQGWVVLLAYIAALTVAAIDWLPGRVLDYVVATTALTVALVVVCIVKGEPQRSRR